MWKVIIARTAQVGPDGHVSLEMKALLAATVGTLLGLLLQVVAVATNSWLLLDVPEELGLQPNATGRWLLTAYTGLWSLCRVELVRKRREDGSLEESERELLVAVSVCCVECGWMW
ncbi:hypothetical protein ACOMHN_001994 [Nucella lapillus]